ncbi:LmeA family phospholipid-binding protein, partial [Nocardia sp. NPDC058497]|uniref:LmeA family phospholipid-binding protein n=1 Tax=Nocardia sp. NPDC058497 TaxID=3346529 RepID=UPI00365D8B43
VSDSPDGLRVTGTFPVAGMAEPATVFVSVAPTDDGIEVTPVSVQPAVGGPTLSLAMLRRTLTFVVPLQQLPLGARLTAIQPGSDGLHATAVADDVRFADLP